MTEVGVYATGKGLIELISQLFHASHIDVNEILAVDNLLDLQLQSEVDLHNTLCLFLDRQTVRFFLYQQGFLIAISKNQWKQVEPTSSRSDTLQNLVNHWISIIGLYTPAIDQIVLVSPSENQGVQLMESGQIVLSQEVELPAHLVQPGFLNEGILMNKKRINLLKKEGVLLKEVKKHRSRLLLLAITLLIYCGLYLGEMGYQIVRYQQEADRLQKEYTEVADRYLPTGASKSNIMVILARKVDEIKKRSQLNSRFAARDYAVSTLLRDLSALRQAIPSIKLQKISKNPGIISFQGSVDSALAFDALRDGVDRILPSERFQVRFNQQSRGDNTVLFTVTARVVEK